MMKKKNLLLSGIAILSLMQVSTSCSSTEVIDESFVEDDTISFCVSAPDAFSFPSTRVSDGLQLRYIGKLYRQISQSDYEYIDRVEMLAKNGNILTFHAEPGNYIVRVFADYIDQNATSSQATKKVKEETLTYTTYGDKFFITEQPTQHDLIEMKAIQAGDGDSKSNPVFYEGFSNINNDDYDCFAASTAVINKTALKYDTKLTLKRAVSKVRIIATGTAGWDHVKSVKITGFSYFNMMNQIENKSSSQNTISTSNIKKDIFTFEPSGKSTSNIGELFYFYTFADTGVGLKKICFEIESDSDEYEFKSGLEIASGTLYPKANIIYNVKGDFLSLTKFPEDIINVTVDQDDEWNNEDKNIK